MGKKYKHNSKGAVLVTTLMVMLVLMILGISLLSASVAEAKHAALQLNRTRAYFAARSGAEIGLRKIQQKLSTGNYNTASSLYSALSSSTFSGYINSGEESYEVTYKNDFISQDKLKIYSEGTVNGVKNTTALTIQFNSPYAMPLNWMNNGYIIKSGTFQNTDQHVVIDVVKHIGHAPKKEGGTITIWKAPRLHFIDNDIGFSLEVTEKPLYLEASLITFKKSILTKSDNDALVLNVFKDVNGVLKGFLDTNGNPMLYNDTDVIPPGYGVLVLREDIRIGNSKNSATQVSPNFTGYYAYPNGTVLSSTAGRTSLIKITNTDTQYYINQIIDLDTYVGLNPKHVVWSKN